MSEQTPEPGHSPPLSDTALRALLTIAVLLIAAWVAQSLSEWLIGLIIALVFGGETLASAIVGDSHRSPVRGITASKAPPARPD